MAIACDSNSELIMPSDQASEYDCVSFFYSKFDTAQDNFYEIIVFYSTRGEERVISSTQYCRVEHFRGRSHRFYPALSWPDN